MRAKGELHLNSERNIIQLAELSQKKKIWVLKGRFLFTCSLQKRKKREGERYGQQSRAERCFRVKMLNIKACFGLRGREERGMERQKNLPANRPHQESLQRKKKKDWDWVEKKKLKEGGQKKRLLLLQSKEDELDSVLIRRLSPDSTIGSLYRLQ